MALKSEAAFQARASEIGISDEDLVAPKDGGINNHARFCLLLRISTRWR